MKPPFIYKRTRLACCKAEIDCYIDQEQNNKYGGMPFEHDGILEPDSSNDNLHDSGNSPEETEGKA